MSRKQKQILIIGANSYVGTSFEKWLARHSDKYHADTIDMIDGTWREKSFAGYDAIFHVAGIAHRKETEQNAREYYEINRDLAVETAKKAKADGVAQFIFMSTMGVYGMLTGVITKETILNPKTHYGKSKLEAEEQIQKLASDSFKVAILRPPMIYGKGCKGNYQKLRAFALKYKLFPNIENRRSMIYIDNLSAYVQSCVETQKDGIFLPQDPKHICTRDMVLKIGECSGVKVTVSSLFNAVKLFSGLNIVKKVLGDLYYQDIDETSLSGIAFPDTIEQTERIETISPIASDIHKLISIITPTYNSSQYIAETIESVKAQTYVNWEMIIVDDCSSDNTDNVVAPYTVEDPRIKYYKLERNSGTAIARNYAIQMSSGDYIAFLDSDDVWCNRKLEEQILFMEQNRYAFSCTGCSFIDENSNLIRGLKHPLPKADYKEVLFHHNPIINSSAMYSVELLGKFEVPNIRKRNDFALWLQILKKEKFAYGLDKPLVRYRIREGSLSHNKLSLIKFHWELYRRIEHLNIFCSSFLVVYCCIYKFLKNVNIAGFREKNK